MCLDAFLLRRSPWCLSTRYARGVHPFSARLATDRPSLSARHPLLCLAPPGSGPTSIRRRLLRAPARGSRRTSAASLQGFDPSDGWGRRRWISPQVTTSPALMGFFLSEAFPSHASNLAAAGFKSSSPEDDSYFQLTMTARRSSSTRRSFRKPRSPVGPARVRIAKDCGPPFRHFRKSPRSGCSTLCSKVSKNTGIGLPLPRLPASTRFSSSSVSVQGHPLQPPVSDRLSNPISKVNLDSITARFTVNMSKVEYRVSIVSSVTSTQNFFFAFFSNKL